MLTIHATSNWPRDSLVVASVPSTRRILPEVESLIESAWQRGIERLGAKLFDGPMCRMESWTARPDRLELRLSQTSYRIFLGTNLSHLADRFGCDVLANPVGISAALLTSDGWLLFGRRNASVAYYPNRIHPFAGSLEPRDLPDPFSAIERELQEELHLSPGDIESIRCIGIAEDHAIRHPEVIFHTLVKLTRAQIESQVQSNEHGGSVAVEAQTGAIEQALANAREFTPVGIATLLLFGNDVFGGEWFNRTKLSAVLLSPLPPGGLG